MQSIDDVPEDRSFFMRSLFFTMFILSLLGLAAAFGLLIIQYDPSLLPNWVPGGIIESSDGDIFIPHFFDIFGIPAAFIVACIFMWSALLTGALCMSGFGSSVYAVIVSAISFILFGAEVPFAVFRIIRYGSSTLSFVIYGITFLMTITAVFIMRDEKRRDPLFFEKAFGTIRSLRFDRAERFTLVLVLLSVVMSVLVVSVSSSYLDLMQEYLQSKRVEIRLQTESFLKQNVEINRYPTTPLVTGKASAPVSIAVFSDPFCPACLSFYKTEEKLEKEFGGSVVFYYYLFPLSSLCNNTVKSASNTWSCSASHYMYAAAKQGRMKEFIRKHGARTKYLRDLFTEKADSKKIYKEYFGTSSGNSDFLKIAASSEADERIADDVAFAKTLKIRKTPTVFINGKRLEASSGYEQLQSIIKAELAGK